MELSSHCCNWNQSERGFMKWTLTCGRAYRTLLAQPSQIQISAKTGCSDVTWKVLVNCQRLEIIPRQSFSETSSSRWLSSGALVSKIASNVFSIQGIAIVNAPLALLFLYHEMNLQEANLAIEYLCAFHFQWYSCRESQNMVHPVEWRRWRTFWQWFTP